MQRFLEAAEDDQSTTGLVVMKVAVALIMLLAASSGCFLAFWLRSLPWFKSWMNRVSLFACGAFIGLSIFHLLPEALYSSEVAELGWHVGKNWYSGCYPLAFGGFLLILCIERIVGTFLQSSDGKNHHAIPLDETPLKVGRASLTISSPSTAALEITTSSDEINNNHSAKQSSSFSSIVLLGVLGLGIHSVFEGMVLGLMEDPVTLWVGSLAIIGHKLPVAISLGISCMKHNLATKTAAWYLAVFCLSTPLGVIIGIFVSRSADLISAIASSLSVGVLLYAGCEALFEQEHTDDESYDQCEHSSSTWEEVLGCTCFLLGGIMILGMMMCHLASGSHDHSEKAVPEELVVRLLSAQP